MMFMRTILTLSLAAFALAIPVPSVGRLGRGPSLEGGTATQSISICG